MTVYVMRIIDFLPGETLMRFLDLQKLLELKLLIGL